MVGIDGKVQARGLPVRADRAVAPGRDTIWTDNSFLKQIQEWYPDPPLVLLISNNEHAKLQWSEAEQSKRYLDKYGRGKSDDFKRKVVGDGWIERYGAMLEGMRAGLTSKTWQKNVQFIGYEAFPPVHFGRWGGWKEYSLYAPDRLDPQPLVWDGGSPSYYLHNWMAITDYTLWSPQIETMNWVFMLDEIHKTRPEFWFELSTWDGDQPGAGNDKRKFYAKLGEPFTPAALRGHGAVRHVADPAARRPRISRLPGVGRVCRAVFPADPRCGRSRLGASRSLQRFWRKGTLVAEPPAGSIRYQADIPPEYKNVERWFLLDTNLTPKELRPEEFDNAKPPSRQTEIPVFALALVLGSAPEREWLVYAHAPRQARTGVAITVPDFGRITVDVPQSGSFFHVKEKGKQVQAGGQGRTGVVSAGGAPLRRGRCAGRLRGLGEVQSRRASSARSSGTSATASRANGDRVTHRFAKPGQYLVTSTGVRDGDRGGQRAGAGLCGHSKPEDGLVCRLLMKGAPRSGMKSWIWLSNWDKVEYHFDPRRVRRGQPRLPGGRRLGEGRSARHRP